MFSLQPTPFDLHMSVLRIPIRVQPTFWLAAVVLGWNPDDPAVMVLWVACMFGSIVFHELGHALTAEACGYPSEIVLYHFGGLAFFRPHDHFPPLRQLLISLAGPIPQICMGCVVLAVGLWAMASGWEFADPERYPMFATAVSFLVYINIGWGLMNLLPVLPLDGGQSMRAIMTGLELRDAEGWALRISVGMGAIICVLAWQFGVSGVALLFLMLTVQNVQELQARRY
jgi:stage IV sporulation protein FB